MANFAKAGRRWQKELGFPELLREGRFDEVLERIARLEGRRTLSPGELVLRGRCLQLSATSISPSRLKEAEVAFRAALDVDGEYIPALLELAWFCYAVEDDSKKALPLFEKAICLEGIEGILIDSIDAVTSSPALTNQVLSYLRVLGLLGGIERGLQAPCNASSLVTVYWTYSSQVGDVTRGINEKSGLGYWRCAGAGSFPRGCVVGHYFVEGLASVEAHDYRCSNAPSNGSVLGRQADLI